LPDQADTTNLDGDSILEMRFLDQDRVPELVGLIALGFERRTRVSQRLVVEERAQELVVRF
jgi:hypothetical protein